MLPNQEYMLQLSGVFHTGQVESGSCFQQLLGSVPTGVILKDVSLEVHGGEVMAVLGSKGSGKRALLEVISRRAQGRNRGQILLNNVPMSQQLFQEHCGYVTQKADLIPGLTVRQTLQYAANMTISMQISGGVKAARVKQVMADMALTNVSNRGVEDLTASEYKRLVIGVQLIRDPVCLLLDEPTWDLDPLNTYFIISILSNHAKKYNRIVVLTMEKPRSDIFPFLDRVTYLCLGDVVYTGSTRMMLDYFRVIGFPCPELENPLMYYLCLSTVDRRSRERFIESNNQIAALVERFRAEGGPYRKHAPPDIEPDTMQLKVPLSAYGRAPLLAVMWSLIWRTCDSIFNFRRSGLKLLGLKLFLLPIFFFILWNFYFPLQSTQQSLVTRTGLIFNCLAGVSFLSIAITASTFGSFRTRYYQESREGVYSGASFVFCQTLSSLPLSALSVCAAASIIFWGLGLGDRYSTTDALWQWFLFFTVLWACYAFVEHQTMLLLMVCKSSFTAAIASFYCTVTYILIGSSTLKTLVGLPKWLYYVSYVIIYRYASAFLHEQMFRDNFVALPSRNATAQINCISNNAQYGCRYLNGTHYLQERYNLGNLKNPVDDLHLYWNFAWTFAFVAGLVVLNIIAYSMPLPNFIKSKFRE
ncbi:ATP-binding cassette sub-family G member 5-like [Pollicipes pollicipes]|uniref:ATP-binding cassette sub-family G member 5-like n=1 Tax=Pollicipes pollicipes TaxID=41117 RepID=UPI001884C62A|nr:ATP-binding cassette sub-family G member 5-like [Pollicipes pollicipes]